jgi:hypothetical protein
MSAMRIHAPDRDRGRGDLEAVRTGARRRQAGITGLLALAWATALVVVRSVSQDGGGLEAGGVLVAGLALATALASLVAPDPA